MVHSKMSVTVPEEIVDEIKRIAANKETKVSHLVTEALAEKIKKIKEEAFISKINKAFEDPEVIKEQRKMANDIADGMRGDNPAGVPRRRRFELTAIRPPGSANHEPEFIGMDGCTV